MSSLNESPHRHYPIHSSRPIGIRPDLQYPRQPQSTTPPYTSADELRSAPIHHRPLMMPRPSYPVFLPSSSSSSTQWVDPRQLPGTPQPPMGYSPSSFGTPSTESGFKFYPNPYPTPYIHQPFYPTPVDTAIIADTDAETEVDKPVVQSAPDSETKFVKPPPRPPNAWIIYRSDMLRAIARGDHMPKLDAAMVEHGISSGEASDGMIDLSDRDEVAAKSGIIKKRAKKPKKGSKEPTAGMLSLGKGKTGRGIPQADVSKLISLMWAREEPAVKKIYENQSAVHKKEHQQKYPGYKFQPLKRADKLRLREEKEREKAEIKGQKLADKRAEKAAVVAAATPPGPKRKGRSKAPAKTPYSGAMSRSKSASTPVPPEMKEEPEYTMYPFPFPKASLPALRDEQSGAEPEQPAPSKYETPMPPPPDPNPAPLTYPQWADMPDLGPAFAVPYIFEPIPIPGEEFNLDLLAPLGDDADADALAALWCSVEEDIEGEMSTWDMTSSEAMQAWSELGSYPQYPSNLQLSSTIAEQIAQDWTANLPQDYNLQPIYDPSLDLIQVPYYDSHYSYLPGTPSPGYNLSPAGPFLSADQPLSPVEPWSAQVNPEVGMPFRHISSGSNRLASSSSHASDSYPSPPAHTVPRHISSSAFPINALSVNSSGWTDRSVSFSAFGPNPASDIDELWGDEEDTTKGLNSSLVASPHSQGHPTPVESVQSPESSDIISGPPRNVRRARTVGSKFSE